jgi:hypothetical protein
VGGLIQIVRTLAQVVPLRVLVVLMVAGGILGLPSWIENVRERQIRGTVRRMVRADPPAREQLESQAIQLAERPLPWPIEPAEGTQRRLNVLAAEAIRYNQRSARDRALAALDAAGADTRALREKISRPTVKFRDPVEAAVRIDNLLKEGLVEAAREQLTIARTHFPDDPELAALQEKLPV